MKVIRFIKEFFENQRGPLLLGLSGGPDSLALLYLLKECKLDFAVAHIDHGWRPESAGEAEQLRLLAEKLFLRFHLKTLDVGVIKGNAEEFCRNERLSFFKMLCRLHGYQGVILGHHADDQAETVLKRVFEGASLARLGAMKPVSQFDGLAILRPLLNISRSEILGYIDENGLSPFNDSTNSDPKFLRARFRQQTIPYLTEQFGKNISKGLNALAKESQELDAYLDRRIQPYLDRIQNGAMGMFLDLNDSYPTEKVELRHLLKRLCEGHVPLSKEQFDILCTLINERAADRSVAAGQGVVFVDRRRLFIMRGKIPAFTSTFSLHEGVNVCGQWTIHVTEADENSLPACSWSDIWRGAAQVVVPHGEYAIGPCIGSENYPRSQSINSWWTNHKVPAFMRSLVPVIRDRGGIRHEFLTGKVENFSLNNHNALITIKLNDF